MADSVDDESVPPVISDTSLTNLPKETGRERVQRLFQLRNGKLSEKMEYVPTIVCVGSIIGLLIGGRFGARIGGRNYIESNQLTVYKSKTHAEREFQSALILGFVRVGCRWGWRTGLFAGFYSTILTVCAEYRDKEDGLNYIAAGATTGVTYKLFSGIRGMIVGSILGSCLSLPVALVVQGLDFFIPEEIKEEKRRLERVKRIQEAQQEVLLESENETKEYDIQSIIDNLKSDASKAPKVTDGSDDE